MLRRIAGILGVVWGAFGLGLIHYAPQIGFDVTPGYVLQMGGVGALGLVVALWGEIKAGLAAATAQAMTHITDPVKKVIITPLAGNTDLVVRPVKPTAEDGEIAMFRAYQQLVRACEANNCPEGLKQISAGWVSLFEALHPMHAEAPQSKIG